MAKKSLNFTVVCFTPNFQWSYFYLDLVLFLGPLCGETPWSFTSKPYILCPVPHRRTREQLGIISPRILRSLGENVYETTTIRSGCFFQLPEPHRGKGLHQWGGVLEPGAMSSRSLKKKGCPNETITWNSEQPVCYGCFNWMIPNHYIKNRCFT